jgi:protein dithiol oxidoreductase (disulfide-forming)
LLAFPVTEKEKIMRRVFLKNSLAAALATSISPFVLAQANGPREGQHYRRVDVVPTDNPKKIEVIEFFWYGCPHCHSLEASVNDWVKKLGPDIDFRKEHVGFPQAIKHQQLFYALKALGVEGQIGPLVFESIHKERKMLSQINDMADLVSKNGIDRKKFMDTFDSFSVKTRMRNSVNLADKYKLDGVPAFSINGKFVTAPSTAGGNAAALQVVDLLVAQERTGRKA